MLPSNKQKIIEQANFTYSPLGKPFEKQIKTIEHQGQKQVEVLKTLNSDNQLTIKDMIPKSALNNNNEAIKVLDKMEEIEKTIDRERLVYKANEDTYSFENFEAIKTFAEDIYDGTITLNKANDYQNDLLIEIMNFKKKAKPKSLEKNKKNKLYLKTCIIFLMVEENFLMLLKAKHFP